MVSRQRQVHIAITTGLIGLLVAFPWWSDNSRVQRLVSCRDFACIESQTEYPLVQDRSVGSQTIYHSQFKVWLNRVNVYVVEAKDRTLQVHVNDKEFERWLYELPPE
jgi:hypothetical protein